jgi:hypothetical protein
MKSNAFAKILQSYSTNCPDSDWSILAAIFAGAKTKPVVDAIGDMSAVAGGLSPDGTGIGALVGEMRVMQATANALGKDPFAIAIGHVLELAERAPHLNVRNLLQAIEARRPQSVPRRPASQPATEAPIKEYAERLEAALSDAATFKDILAELNTNKNMSAAAWKQLAKVFTQTAARTRSDAVAAIVARQSNALDARTKDAANAGRTAA